MRGATRRALARIRGILLDADGVMTDGRIVYLADGGEMQTFSARDGYGIARGRRAGLVFAIVSGRRSPMVARWMSSL